MYTKDNFQVVSQSGSITITNRGAFLSSAYLSYRHNGRLIEQSSPYILVLQKFKFNIPMGATDIRFLGVLWFDSDDWKSICRYESNTPETKCYYFWGTLFYAGCQEIPCTGNDNGDNDLTPPCYCCCCHHN